MRRGTPCGTGPLWLLVAFLPCPFLTHPSPSPTRHFPSGFLTLIETRTVQCLRLDCWQSACAPSSPSLCRSITFTSEDPPEPCQEASAQPCHATAPAPPPPPPSSPHLHPPHPAQSSLQPWTPSVSATSALTKLLSSLTDIPALSATAPH